MLVPAENLKRQIIINGGNKENFTIGCIGINSYISNMSFSISEGDETINLCIGNFTSISNGIIVHINRNHDFKSISQHFYSSGNPEVDIFNFTEKKIQQKGHIFIGSDCWIGANVTLMSGIKIGNGALIGTNSVVAKDIPPYAVVVGNPAKIVKYRFTEEQIIKLLAIQWWNWEIDKIRKNIEWFKKDVQAFIGEFYKNTELTIEDNIDKTDKVRILFFPDFHEAYPIWRKVLREYYKTISSNKDTVLILKVDADSNLDKNNEAEIKIINKYIKDEELLFKDVNYFIATRSIDTIDYIEYANKYKTTILSGTNIPIFPETFFSSPNRK